jgi:arsenate reductase (thioredoxin)
LSQLKTFIDQLPTAITEERQRVLQPLLDYIKLNTSAGRKSQINFICTHNSRRSQLAQVWMQAIALTYRLDVLCFSGGVEVTSCAPQTIDVLKKCGFIIRQFNGHINPNYQVQNDGLELTLFSKLFNDAVNPKANFAAVMTCGHAEANCPFVPGCDARFAVTYEDPKQFDGDPEEQRQYQRTSDQIAAEMKWVISRIS